MLTYFREKFTKSACMRVLSLALCISLLFFIFALIPLPAGADSGVFDVTESAITSFGTYNGFYIYNNNKLFSCALKSIYNLFGDCCVFGVAEASDGNYYIPVITNIPQANIHGDGQYIYVYGSSNADTSIGSCKSDGSSHTTRLYLDTDTSGHCLVFSGNRSYIKSYYDFSGNDVSSNIDVSSLNFKWAIYPNHDWDILNKTAPYDGKLKLTHISATSDSSGFISSSNAPPSPVAKFTTFESSDTSGIYFIDWLSAGLQYPTVDFYINDNNNFHDYSLRISVNDKYTDICLQAWDNYRKKEITSNISSGVGLVLSLASVAGKGLISIAGSSFPIGWLLVNSPVDISDKVNIAAQGLMLQQIGSSVFNVSRNLSDSSLHFAEGSSSVRAYSICLVDYLTITKGLVYKLDIVDSTTGFILDTALFTSDMTFGKTDTGYGTKVHEYSNQNDLDSDLNGGAGYISSDTNTTGGSLSMDNNNDIVDFSKYPNLNIEDLYGTFTGTVNDVTSFFQACWGLFPPAIWSIILLGLTLIVVLRVLGR